MQTWCGAAGEDWSEEPAAPGRCRPCRPCRPRGDALPAEAPPRGLRYETAGVGGPGDNCGATSSSTCCPHRTVSEAPGVHLLSGPEGGLPSRSSGGSAGCSRKAKRVSKAARAPRASRASKAGKASSCNAASGSLRVEAAAPPPLRVAVSEESSGCDQSFASGDTPSELWSSPAAEDGPSRADIEVKYCDHRLRLSFKGMQADEPLGNLAAFTNSCQDDSWLRYRPPKATMASNRGYYTQRATTFSHALSMILSNQSTMGLSQDCQRPLLQRFPTAAIRRVVLGFVTVALVLIAALLLFVAVLGSLVADELLEVQDSPLRGDPGYLIDFFGSECLRLKDTFAPVLPRLEAYNQRFGWRELVYPARGDRRPVRALYFPGEKQGTTRAPRVIVVHGVRGSFLHSAVQTVALYLRAMNISVLAPNLRNHGGRNEDRFWADWQHQWMDVLGAWDLAVKDPEGLLGGPLDAAAVGLMGFDYGGLVAQAVFGVEHRVRALLVDGAVHELRALLRHGAEERLPGIWPALPAVLRASVLDRAWSRCEARVGHSLGADYADRTPRLLAWRRGGVLGVIHAASDRVVPVEQSHLLLEAVAGNAHGPDVALRWFPQVEACRQRRAIHLERPAEYHAQLCAFWSSVFDGSHGGAAPRRCAAAAAALRALLG